ncbi:MAG: signal recognition particle-docking protein FtsY, partial [Lentisphaerae bacterium]
MASLWERLKLGLNTTRTSLARNLKGLFVETREWTSDDYEKLEAALIQADLGVRYATRFVEDVRQRYERGEIKTAADILKIAREDVARIMSVDQAPVNFAGKGPTVIILVG